MRRQRNTSNTSPDSPRLFWRYPAQPVADSRATVPPSEDDTGDTFKRDGVEVTPTPEEVAAHGLRAVFHCVECDSYRPTPKGYGGAGYCGGTGYGHDANTGRAVCYRCCGERDKRDARNTGRAVFYLVRVADKSEHTTGTTGRAPHLRAENWRVQNWPGSLSLPVLSLKRGSHNWRNVSRVDVWYVFEGYVWHGVQLGDSEIIRCKRTRTEWRDLGNGRGFGPVTPRKSRAKSAKVSP